MTLVFAHRGAAAELPENTLPSFRRALELGADALETDVHLTLDGEVVAVHDADGERIAGVSRAVGAARLSEVQSWDAGYVFVDSGGARPFAGQGFRVPTLDELLAAIPAVKFNVDLKQPDAKLVQRFIEVVRRHDAESRVVAASFHATVLQQLRTRGYAGETSLARREFLACWLLPSFLRRGPPPGQRAQIPTHAGPVPLATRCTVDKLHALGLRVDFWTVNDPVRARQLVRLGADGVMTDDPARIVPAVRTAEARGTGPTAGERA